MKKNRSYNKLLNDEKAFTLVELLLYITIVFFIILGVSGFFTLILQSRIKNQAMSEVGYQGEQVVNLISQAIRNAEAINSPDKQSDDDVLSLEMADSADSPAIFDLSNGVIQIKEGNGDSIDLTNSKVVVSDLIFYDHSQDDSPGFIHFQFSLSYKDPESMNGYNYSKNFYGGATLRK